MVGKEQPVLASVIHKPLQHLFQRLLELFSETISLWMLWCGIDYYDAQLFME